MKILSTLRFFKLLFLLIASSIVNHSVSAQQTCNAYVGGGCADINAMYVKLDATSRISGVLGNTTAENTLLKFARDNGIKFQVFFFIMNFRLV